MGLSILIWGNYHRLSSAPDRTTPVLKEREAGGVIVREGYKMMEADLEDAAPLAFKMEEGAMGQRVQAGISRSWKGQGNRVLPCLQKEPALLAA